MIDVANCIDSLEVFAVAFAASAGRNRKPEKWTNPGDDAFGEGHAPF